MALTIENTNLVISTEPEYADQLITLTSDNPSVVEPEIVSTSESGVNTYRLVANGVGTATLTATAPGGATSSVLVTVTSTPDDAGNEGGGEGGGSVIPDPTPTTIKVSEIYFHEPNSAARVESLGFSLNPSSLIEMSPYITVEPSDAANRSWTLSSSNPSVLAVNGASVRTASTGGSNLTVTANDGSGYSDTVSVTVTAVSATSIRFNTSSLELPVGATRDLSSYLTFTPALSVYGGYTVESTQSAIVKVIGNSSIKAMAAGESVITARTSSGCTATMTITVTAQEEGDISYNAPSNFYINCSKTTLTAGESATVQLVRTVPAGLDLASSGELQLVFQNSRCIRTTGPDEDGTFTIQALNNPGDEVIRMRWRNDSHNWISSEPISITVLNSSSGEGGIEPQIVLSAASIVMSSFGKIPGDEFQANVNITPSNYLPSSITWTSSNSSIASVSNAGYIVCSGEGTVTISVNVDGMTASRTFVVGNDNGSEQNPTDWAEDDYETPLGGTNVAAGLVPFTTADKYPTHYAKYGKGGYRSVSNISERNAIPEGRREEGMLAWVISESKLYQLRSGYWVAAGFGSGSGTTNPDDPDNPGTGNCRCCEELEPRIAALEAILLAQQQNDLRRQLDNSPYTLNITGLRPSASKFEVGATMEATHFNYSLSGPDPIPAMQSAIINGATVSNPSGIYDGPAVDSSSAGNKELYRITVKYFDTRYAQLDEWKQAGGRLMEASASKSVMFGYKIYCGKTTLDPADFNWPNLSTSVIGTASIVSGLPAKSSPLTFSYSVTRGRAWVAYPKAWGQSVDIRDSLGQSYAVDFSFKEISVPVAGSQVPYYVYYLTDASDANDFEFNFSKK